MLRSERCDRAHGTRAFPPGIAVGERLPSSARAVPFDLSVRALRSICEGNRVEMEKDLNAN